MLKNYNDNDLMNKKVARKYHLFIQVWKELTERKTMDTYQYRIMNTLSIIRELNRIIEIRLAQLVINNININECCREAIVIIKRDVVLQSFYPSIYRRLLVHLNTKIDKDADIRMLHYQMKYCYSLIEKDYLVHMIEIIKKYIDKGENKEVVKLANSLVSVCVDMGWSLQFLAGLTSKLNESLDDIDEKWEDFSKIFINHRVEKYVIYIPIKIRSSLANKMSKHSLYDDVSMNGIIVRNGEDLNKIENYLIEFSDKDKYAVIEEYAYDYYTASRKALGEYSNILNLMSFYGVVKPWNTVNLSWIVVNTNSNNHKKLTIKDIYNIYDYIEGMTKLYKSAKDLEEGVNNDICKRLRAVYSFVNTGRASYFQENQFINIWVALESLCRTQMYSNIISNITETVPNALCIRYIYKIYRNFIEDCFRCDLDLSDFGIVKGILQSKQEQVSYIMNVFIESGEYNKLIDRCKVNALLRLRCEELHEMLNDKNSLYERIKKHHYNVKCQLSRLYRMRNEIAHSAFLDLNNSNFIKMIEHLDDYLISFVSEVVRCASAHSNDSIELEEIFEIMKNNYRDFVEITELKRKLNLDSSLEDLFKTGVINLIG